MARAHEPVTTGQVALRGTVLFCRDDPGVAGPGAVTCIEDGVLVVDGGRVGAVGEAAALLGTLAPGTPVEDWRDHLIVPGFVDTHVHYPQAAIIASHGTRLLDWLERYTFPAEARFADAGHAAGAAAFFCDQLLAEGTTSAMVWCTVHPQSVDALFEAARARGMCIIAGKVMMDRNCPPELRDTPAGGRADAERLIECWHGCGRLAYALTPRFAPTSSDAQLAGCGELLAARPDLYLQTHLAENADEVAWVAELHPRARSYVDVYERFGLLGRRSVLAHCLHLDDADRALLAERGATMAFCPTSNLFLGSGLFDVAAADRHGNAVALATDVGGGTSFSMLRTLGEAYKVAQMAGQHLEPARLLYLATLAGARALDRDGQIGSFVPGAAADVVVLDPCATPASARRVANGTDALDRFFALTMLGDDRHVASVRVGGAPVAPRAY